MARSLLSVLTNDSWLKEKLLMVINKCNFQSGYIGSNENELLQFLKKNLIANHILLVKPISQYLVAFNETQLRPFYKIDVIIVGSPLLEEHIALIQESKISGYLTYSEINHTMMNNLVYCLNKQGYYPNAQIPKKFWLNRPKTRQFASKPRFTKTENKILALLCNGYTITEISLQTKTSVSNIRNHIGRLKTKVLTRTKNELISISVANHWATPSRNNFKGGILNITSTTINMAGGSKIIVEEGGTLNINNTTITNDCDIFWGGIEVLSGPTNTQHCASNTTCVVGKVFLNNATIENSEFGIRNWGSAGTSSGAGVIQATNSNFLNNRRAIQFRYFENHAPNTNTVIANSSYFKNCTFIIDANYLFDVQTPLESMVSLWEVRGISFRGCEFTNTSGQTINTIGILSVNAQFSVKDICTGFTPCTTTIKSSFSGLKAGISAHGSGKNYTVLVDNALFNDNKYGVISSGISGAVITRNIFTPFAHSTTDPLHTSTTAIYFESSGQYTVEENTITGFPSNYVPTGGIPFTYGIVAKRSGNGSNKLYKNTFSQLSTANVAYGLNHNPTFEPLGLKYECNSMSTSVNGDITIYGPNAGIATTQGSSAKGADNTFTTGMLVPEGHLHNNANQSLPLTYYHHTQTGYNFEPTNISSNVVTQLVSGAFSESANCPTHLGGFNQLNPGKMDLLDYTGKWGGVTGGVSGFNQAKYLYTALIDGGDTYALLSTVQGTNTQTAWDVRTDLINASPLSIEVLHETVDEGLLSNALLHDVLMVNPHGVRDEEIMFKLENKTTPMPAYMINTLLGIYEAQTQKDVLEAEMAFELQQAHEAARFLTLNWAVDSLNPLNDSILILNDSLNTPAADWASVAHHVAKGNYTPAQNIIAAMPNKFVLSDYEDTKYNELNSYYTNYIAMLQTGMDSFKKPSSTQLANLQLLAADSTTKAGRMAQNLILFAEGKVFWPTLQEESQNKKEATNPRKKRVVIPENVATVYPNPTSEYVTIRFTEINSDEPLLIKVITSTGTEVLTHSETLPNGGLINLMTKTLASGQYFVLIYQNNTLLQKQALEIIH